MDDARVSVVQQRMTVSRGADLGALCWLSKGVYDIDSCTNTIALKPDHPHPPRSGNQMQMIVSVHNQSGHTDTWPLKVRTHWHNSQSCQNMTFWNMSTLGAIFKAKHTILQWHNSNIWSTWFKCSRGITLCYNVKYWSVTFKKIFMVLFPVGGVMWVNRDSATTKETVGLSQEKGFVVWLPGDLSVGTAK